MTRSPGTWPRPGRHSGDGGTRGQIPARTWRRRDWDHRLFDAVVAKTSYAGRRVLGMLDCLWGLLDGINHAGLAVSLTFGGRPQVGEGFGIPLVIRYVLETCRNTGQAMRALRRIPVHMSYNVTALDPEGARATAYLAPDRPAHITSLPVATNHQEQVEWAPYAAAIRSVERRQHLERLLAAGSDAEAVVAACLRPPLYATRFHEGFGTLYTAEYRPADGRALSLARRDLGTFPRQTRAGQHPDRFGNRMNSSEAPSARDAPAAQGRLKATLTRVPPGPDTMLIRSATWRTTHNPCPGAPDMELVRVWPCGPAAWVVEPAGCQAGSSAGGSPSSTWQRNSLTSFHTRSRPAPAPWRMALAASS